MNDAQKVKLDGIRSGAETLTALAEGRILEAQEALASGNYRLALTRLDEARTKLVPVVQAINYMDFEPGTHIIRAKQLQEGMVLTGLGRIEDVDVTTDDHGHDEPCVNVIARIEDHPQPQQFGGDQEVVILVGR